MDMVIPSGLTPVPFFAFDSQGDLYIGNEREHEVLRYRRPRGRTEQKLVP
jgi:hypothetical protein